MASDLGRRFAVDTNLIGRSPPGMAEIQSLANTGQIQLIRTDVVDTELSTCKDDDLRAHLLAFSSRLPEQLGVWVLGHSRLGRMVLGSDDDAAIFERVWSTLFPGRDRATAPQNDVRDAMHVWTSIRYGADALLTLDGDGKGKGLLDRDPAITVEFDGFHIWTPAQAWAFVERLLYRQQYREQHPR